MHADAEDEELEERLGKLRGFDEDDSKASKVDDKETIEANMEIKVEESRT